ncbi:MULTISPECIES: hypothetical protein [Bacteria]|uniref:hypothetical protein n=1 Tax=Bacteria TaxID=2 RepID=UPI003EE470D4
MSKKTKKNLQFIELSRAIYNFKKISKFDNEDLFKKNIMTDLSKICLKNGNFLFSKTQILKLLTNLNSNKVTYAISEKNLNIAKGKGNKSIIKFQSFLIYFAIPDIIDTIKDKNL